MKKIILIALTLILCFSLFSCSSSIPVKDLESRLQKTEKELTFDLKDNGSGYDFLYKNSQYTLEGTADKEKNVTFVKITGTNVDSFTLSSKERLTNMFNQLVTDYSQLTIKEIKLNHFISVVGETCAVLCDRDGLNTSKIADMLSSGETIEGNGWTVRTDNNSIYSETFVIVAERS